MQSLRSKGSQKSTQGFTLVEIMIVVLIIGILLAIAIPNFVQARESSRAKACIANLKQIDSAKQQYAMDNKIAGNSTTAITNANLQPAYLRSVPICPSAGTYTNGDVATAPTCSVSAPGAGDYAKGDPTAATPIAPGKFAHALP